MTKSQFLLFKVIDYLAVAQSNEFHDQIQHEVKRVLTSKQISTDAIRSLPEPRSHSIMRS